MMLDEKESGLLKQWIVKKLEDISDADSDVLADYVVALAKSDEPEPAAKGSCIENLKDFLLDNTESFVDQLFQAVSTKSYDPSRPPSKPAPVIYQPPKRTSAEFHDLANGSRKRSYHDWDRNEQVGPNGFAQSYDVEERPMKHPRRGGRGHDHRGGREPRQQFEMPQMPTPPPGMPPIDPHNPMAAFMAMQQALGFLPPMPNGMPTSQRCRDYDEKGFCAAGASCPYEHGNDPVVFPPLNQQYDPTNSMLSNLMPSRTGQMNFSHNERGRGGPRARGRGANNFRGGGHRSTYAQLGPSRDRTNTTIVVESIPEDKCNDQSIRDFFSKFGAIEEVKIEMDKKLAIIKFDSHDAAQAAYESPKVVFDNRFVKVFWYKSDAQIQAVNGSARAAQQQNILPDVEMQDDDQVDPLELARKQEEAQRKHDEAKKQRDEVIKQREDLAAKLKAKEEERLKMADLIAKKAGKAKLPEGNANGESGLEENERTKGLKAQLAKLEAEARGLGLDPHAANQVAHDPQAYRGRGGFRGRARGRGYNPGFRGGWAAGRGGAVMRLDNRPKTIAVTFAEGNFGTHEEALRQFLLFGGLETANIAKHPERDDTALVSFNQRFEGENFMASVKDSELLHVGKVELSWFKPNDVNTPVRNGNHESDVVMNQTETAGQPPTTSPENGDYGMGDDEDLDHW